jgi:hypothetical protein
MDKITAFETYMKLSMFIDKTISDHITDIAENNNDLIFKDILIEALNRTIETIKRIT